MPSKWDGAQLTVDFENDKHWQRLYANVKRISMETGRSKSDIIGGLIKRGIESYDAEQRAKRDEEHFKTRGW